MGGVMIPLVSLSLSVSPLSLSPPPSRWLTQDGDDHVGLDDLHAAVTEVVDVVQRVTAVDQVLAGRAEAVLDVQREQLLAAGGGGDEDGQLQQLPVDVHRDIAAQFLGEVVQDLMGAGGRGGG